MTRFYLLRHKDVHGNSGSGTVAEGVIFDNGMVSMIWLTDIPTITMFTKITDVVKLHSHAGLTDIIIEGRKKQQKLFEQCEGAARLKNTIKKRKKEQ